MSNSQLKKLLDMLRHRKKITHAQEKNQSRDTDPGMTMTERADKDIKFVILNILNWLKKT